MIEVGQRLPEVLGIDQDGKEWKISDFKGKKLVLYIYPKDSTPGCTNEACNLRDNYERFISQGYSVLGCSTQDAKSHHKFIEKHQLPFPLATPTSNSCKNSVYMARRRWLVARIWASSAQPLSRILRA